MKDSYSDGIFNVGAKDGFLPSYEPLEKLSETYSGVQTVIDNLPTLLQEAGRIEVGRLCLSHVHVLHGATTMVRNEMEPHQH